jgi:spermidine synthase
MPGGMGMGEARDGIAVDGRGRVVPDLPPFALPFVAAAFFLSGASALVYQIAWQRMLGIFGGSDSLSAALAVGAFLLGLGLGSLWASTFVDRLGHRRALIGFAVCEVGIALFAAASPIFLNDFLLAWLAPMAKSRVLVFTVAFLGMLAPTVLMGLSLPLLARALVRRIETSASRIAILYSLNTFGAGIGAAVAGFVAIGSLGFTATILIAAAINLLVAVAAFAAAAWIEDEPIDAASQQTARPGEVPLHVWRWCGLVFLSGFLIIALEIVWLRVIGTIMEGNVYTFPLVLSVFLVADAVGILIGIRVSRRSPSARALFAGLQGWVTLYALGALLVLYELYAYPGTWAVLGGLGWLTLEARHLVPMISLTILLVAPPAILLGMSFPIVQRAVQEDPGLVGQRVSLIQLFNILGNTAGSLVTGLVLLHVLGTVGTLLVVGAIGLGFVAWLIRLRLPGPRRGLTAPLGAAAGLSAMLAVFPVNDAFWNRMHIGAKHEDSRAVISEGRSGLALLRHWNEIGILYVFGHLQSTLPFASYHVLLGALGPLTHPDPRSVLVIGSGIGSTPFAAGLDPRTERIRVVELVEPVLGVMRRYADLGHDLGVRRMLDDRRYEFVVGDGRHDLTISEERFDVIEADALLPKSGNSGLLYSEEFFELVRSRLKEGGLAVQWAPTERTVDTFARVFAHVVQVRPFNVLIGSDRPIPFNIDRLSDRLADPAIRQALADARLDAPSLIRHANGVPVHRGPGSAKGEDVNTDLFPKDEYYLNRWKAPW